MKRPSLKKKYQRGFIINPYVFGSAAPPPPAPADTNFSKVELLLHGDAETGFPSDFVDSSKYRRVPSAVGGTPSLDTTTKAYGASSIRLPSGSWLQWDDWGNYKVTADFTIEVTFKPANTTNDQCIMSVCRPGATTGADVSWILTYNPATRGGKVVFTYFVGTTAYEYASINPISTTSFSKICMQRTGTVWRLFVNGILAGGSTVSHTVNIPTGMVLRLGRYIDATPLAVDGWFDEVRYTVGAARYAISGYTTATDPFPDQNGQWYPDRTLVSALLHFDGAENATTTVDSGPLALSPTMHNLAKLVSANAVFGPTGLYLVSASGGNVKLPNNAAFQFQKQDFTVSIRFRMAGHSRYNNGSYKSTLWGRDTAATGREFSISLAGTGTSTTAIEINLFESNASVVTVAVPYTFALNTNYHLEVCRKGNFIYVFLNGVLLQTTAYDKTIQATGNIAVVGALLYSLDYFYYFDGWIDEVLVVKGLGLNWKSYTSPAEAYPNT